MHAGIIASNVISVYVDDWLAKIMIIASNVNSVHVDDWIAKWVTIASNITDLSSECNRNEHDNTVFFQN